MNDNFVNNEQEVTTEKVNNKSYTMLIVGIAMAVLLLVGGFVIANRNSNSSNANSVLSQESSQNDVGTSGSETTPMNTSDPEAMVESNEQPVDAMDEGEIKIIEVEGGAFYYEPNEITVKAGREVTIVLNSVDMMHDFVIDELNVKTEIAQAGETVEVTFTVPEEAGEYEYYCSVGSHRANGMVGTLTITE